MTYKDRPPTSTRKREVLGGMDRQRRKRSELVAGHWHLVSEEAGPRAGIHQRRVVRAWWRTFTWGSDHASGRFTNSLEIFSPAVSGPVNCGGGAH